MENGFAWALLALFLALNIGGIGLAARAYVASAAIILVVSIIETSYAMAYHDELTGLPSRRAFNDATLQLEAPYTVAGVDIDHFKSVNDTFGHETGDEVLCMVAGNLARVTGGGQPFRVGGEEFTILFPGKSPAAVMEHVEFLRQTIEESPFRLRGSADRRSAPRGPDRRSSGRKKNTRTRAKVHRGSLQVTVSIGVAAAQSEDMKVEEVLKLADQALYAAKRGGRNRVEVAGPVAETAKEEKRSKHRLISEAAYQTKQELASASRKILNARERADVHKSSFRRHHSGLQCVSEHVHSCARIRRHDNGRRQHPIPNPGLSGLRHPVASGERQSQPSIALLHIRDLLESFPRAHRHRVILRDNGVHLQITRSREPKPCTYSLVRTPLRPLRANHSNLNVFRLSLLHPVGALLRRVASGRSLYIKDGTPTRHEGRDLMPLNATNFFVI